MPNPLLQYWRKFIHERRTSQKKFLGSVKNVVTDNEQVELQHNSEYQRKLDEAEGVLRDLNNFMTQSKQKKSSQENWSNIVELPEVE